MADFRPTKKAQSDDREEKAWALRCKGWSQPRIAAELGIDQSSVARALQRATEKHHKAFMADIEGYKQNQAALIESAAFSALEQYMKSQQQLNIVEKSGRMIKGKFVEEKSTTTVKKIDQYGDKGLLAMFYKGMEEARKIRGCDVPASNKNHPDGKLNPDTMTIDEKIALFTSIPIEERLKILSSMLTPKQHVDEPVHLIEDEN